MLSDKKREEIIKVAHANALTQWGKPLPPKAVALIRLYAKQDAAKRIAQGLIDDADRNSSN